MDFKEILEHHILDHRIATLFSVGGLNFDLTKHLLIMWIVCALLLLIFGALRFAPAHATRRLRILLEMIVLFIRDDIVVPAMGPEGQKYLHYFLTLFFFILFCNLIGIVPSSATPTGNISVTATLAILTFCLIHFAGIRAQGLPHYLKNIVPSGLPWWLVPLMVPIELIGFLTRTFALAIRLFMNMIAGHIVILAFIGLIFLLGKLNPVVGYVDAPISVALALFIDFMELAIVIPLQAYIFTFLTALFVGAAVHPEH